MAAALTFVVHPMFRQGLAEMLGRYGAEVDQAASGPEAIAKVAERGYRAVLMDVAMQGMSGIEATAQPMLGQPSLAVVMLTMHPEPSVVRDALGAGAAGYLLKESTPAQIRAALAAVVCGHVVLGAGLPATILAAATKEPIRMERLPGVTEREDEVLDLLAAGMTNREIAGRLFLSDKTVRNYVSGLSAKLGVADRGGAVARARDLGYGKGDLR